MRTVIVDDERLARNELRRMLRDFREIDVIGEAADGESAIKLIGQVNADLIFLDIQARWMDLSCSKLSAPRRTSSLPLLSTRIPSERLTLMLSITY